MKHLTILTFLCALALGTVQTAQADAGMKNAIKLMITMRITDSKTIKHNITQYERVLARISQEASSRKHSSVKRENIIDQINYLDERLDRQLGFVGPALRPVLAPKITRSFNNTKKAAEDHDFRQVLKNVSEASKELKQLKNI